MSEDMIDELYDALYKYNIHKYNKCNTVRLSSIVENDRVIPYTICSTQDLENILITQTCYTYKKYNDCLRMLNKRLLGSTNKYNKDINKLCNDLKENGILV